MQATACEQKEDHVVHQTLVKIDWKLSNHRLVSLSTPLSNGSCKSSIHFWKDLLIIYAVLSI